MEAAYYFIQYFWPNYYFEFVMDGVNGPIEFLNSHPKRKNCWQSRFKNIKIANISDDYVKYKV